MSTQRRKSQAAKSLRTLLGGLVMLVGVVTIPYPGPGWLIVFTGLAILARDYPAAQKVLDYAHMKYDAWQAWLRRQLWPVQAIVWLLTAIIVVVTIWLLNGYGIMNTIFNLNIDWLVSPFAQ
ncbi:MAG: TIGR02611 family protein [Candidatus Saccharimonadales bacterium]|nr:hypothetical protein [Patescibacteria group bacterium]